MEPVAVWILVALATSVVVLLLAGATGERSGGIGQFLTDLRAGLSRVNGPREGILAGARREMVEVADVETTSVEDIFTVGTTEESGYVEADEITEPLSRARDRAVRGVTQLTRR